MEERGKRLMDWDGETEAYGEGVRIKNGVKRDRRKEIIG